MGYAWETNPNAVQSFGILYFNVLRKKASMIHG